MRRSHFEAIQPVCPRCRGERQVDSPLHLAAVLREDSGDVLEGVLHCTDTACYLEFPIIDGIPILVPAPRAYLSDNVYHLLARDDLSETIESILGDCAGPGAAFDATRQHLSTYTWDNYGDLDPAEAETGPAPGAAVRCLDAGLGLAGAELDGPVLDLGCSVGRTSFALADRCDGPVLGVDVHVPMLRAARRILTTGTVRYARRRLGVVYDRREFAAPFDGADRVDFWACDALALPFRDNTFGFVAGINVLDCVGSPRDMLASLARVLHPGGSTVLSTPYDWSPNATAFEAWIGGHSQRGPDRGAAEPMLRKLLTPGEHPQSIDGLRITGEIAGFPWQTRLHDRSIMTYDVHVLAAEAAAT
ncbi:MAG: methyltransferase domain-containing protein [Alphaproteobacteria bacterium]